MKLDLASYIRIQMKAQNLNGIELSQKSGLDTSTISKIISGKTKYPSYESLEALSSGLELHISTLIDLIPKKFQARPVIQYQESLPRTESNTIPVFSMTQANQLHKENLQEFQKEALNLAQCRIDRENLFVVRIDHTLFPFQKGCELTIDPHREASDMDFVLVRTAQEHATIGRLEKSANSLFIRSLDSDTQHWREPLSEDPSVLVIGVICDMYMSFQ